MLRCMSIMAVTWAPAIVLWLRLNRDRGWITQMPLCFAVLSDGCASRDAGSRSKSRTMQASFIVSALSSTASTGRSPMSASPASPAQPGSPMSVTEVLIPALKTSYLTPRPS